MIHVAKRLHDQQIDKWFGNGVLDGIAKRTKGWYGEPIPLLGVPGAVFATGRGDIVGRWRGGFYSTWLDFITAKIRTAMARQYYSGKVFTGFASLSDLIAEATQNGKAQDIIFQKTGVAKPAVGYCQDLWNKGTVPVAGANGGAAPGGTLYDRASAGALPFDNPAGTDTAHLTTGYALGSVVGALLLYDRLFAVACSHNSANVAITGVPTRYQGVDAKNTFASARVTTILSATVHNITITYMDQDGNTAEAAAAQAARVSAAVDSIPLTAPQWFFYLNDPDRGIRKVTNWATNGANTGASDFFLGHILAILPFPLVNLPVPFDGINSAFSLAEVKTGACLAWMEYFMPATTLLTVTGLLKVVAG